MNFLRRDQILHRRLQRLVSHPVLNRADVEPRPTRPGGVGRTKRFEVELRFIQSGTLGDRLTVVQHVVLEVPCRRWKHELVTRTDNTTKSLTKPNTSRTIRKSASLRSRSEERRVGKECRSRWSP